MSNRFVAYFRVSTQKQGEDGLGMEAQAMAVASYVARVGGEVVATFKEVESGRKDARPELDRALEECKRRRATLVIAKLDRLSRRVSFISKLMDGKVPIVACDFPEANELTLHIMAAVAQHERKAISARTKAAMAAAKARYEALRAKDEPAEYKIGQVGKQNLAKWKAAGGVPFAERREETREADDLIRPFVEARASLSLRALAAALDEAGHRPRGGAARWSAEAVRQLRRRLET